MSTSVRPWAVSGHIDLDRLATSARNVLWCEADAYDQLFLIAALASPQLDWPGGRSR